MSGPLGLDWVDNSEEWDPSDPAVLATVREHGGDTFADRIHLLADGRIRQQVMMDGDPFASTYFDIDSSLVEASESDDGETSVGGGSSPGGSSSPSADTDDSAESASGVGWLLDGDGSRTNFIALGVAAAVAIGAVVFGGG
ncbi:hypothetical protein C5B89_06625 [Haloferax sp. Atlit-47N]|uniref:hypothetical protein n=1 Tax=Haloferax sp. Atlit-47N TaxID=2077199 RepID=UPI000E263BAD|nr:hypothetical protein [Haloferax sp. Atlit-47N]RDZ41611.1 hypothetical protein C5B89_06625 [Haloferax sp. Atlit-47N]